jgi:hypothetical protein
MLIRVAPRFFQADTGDTVTIAAVAQNNNGSEGATFQYGGAPLADLTVGAHPACEFVVQHNVKTLSVMLLFDPTSPNASYDLFEVDAAGNLVALQVNAPAFAGMFTQFQIDGRPVAAFAAARFAERAAMSSAKAAPHSGVAAVARVPGRSTTMARALKRTGAQKSARASKTDKPATAPKRTRKTARADPRRSGETARGQR